MRFLIVWPRSVICIILLFSNKLTFSQNVESIKQYGLLYDEKNYLKVPMISTQVSRNYTQLLKKVSLKEFCPDVGFQQFSDCVGWATTYSSRTILYAIKHNIKEKNEIKANTFSPSFTYEKIKSKNNGFSCNEGTYISSGIDLLKNIGSIKFSSLNYQCSPKIDSTHLIEANNFKIQDYKRLTESYIPDKTKMIERLRKSIFEKRPVIISINVYSSFQNLNSLSTNVWNGNKDLLLGKHALTIIGYDDDKYGGSFEIMNSWGIDWGNKGFIWIKYSDFIDICNEAYEITDNIMPYKSIDNNLNKIEVSLKFKIILENGSELGIIQKSNSRDLVISNSLNGTNYISSKPMHTNDKFRININTTKPGFVYMIGFNASSNKISKIFPFQNYSANLDYSENEILIPNEDYWIQLDENLGKEYLCIFFSTAIIDIDKLLNTNSKDNFNIFHSFNTIFKDRIDIDSSIIYFKNTMGFKVNMIPEQIVPLIIEINHIK